MISFLLRQIVSGEVIAVLERIIMSPIYRSIVAKLAIVNIPLKSKAKAMENGTINVSYIIANTINEFQRRNNGEKGTIRKSMKPLYFFVCQNF